MRKVILDQVHSGVSQALVQPAALGCSKNGKNTFLINASAGLNGRKLT